MSTFQIWTLPMLRRSALPRAVRPVGSGIK
jgi:hypothetical protein